MVEYYIEAIDQQGRPHTLSLSAKNSTMADELVRSQGLHPTLITHAKAHEREQEEQLQRKKRRRTFSIAGIVVIPLLLIVGLALRVHIRNLERARGFSLDSVRTAALAAGAAERTTGANDDLAAFASDLFGAMHLQFPGLLSRINVKSETLMFVDMTRDIEEQPAQEIRSLTRLLTQALQQAFQSDQCTVYVLLDRETLADGRYSMGETTVNVHVED